MEALKLQILNFGLMGGGVELGLSPLLVLHWKASKTKRCLSQAFIVLVATEKNCFCALASALCQYLYAYNTSEKKER